MTFYGNQIDHNTTGCSENVSFDGNVQYWVMANNSVHDGDNIGLNSQRLEGENSSGSTQAALNFVED